MLRLRLGRYGRTVMASGFEYREDKMRKWAGRQRLLHYPSRTECLGVEHLDIGLVRLQHVCSTLESLLLKEERKGREKK